MGGELVTLGVVAKWGEQGIMRINYNNKSGNIPSLIYMLNCSLRSLDEKSCKVLLGKCWQLEDRRMQTWQ